MERFAVDIIQEEKRKQDIGDTMWKDSPYREINELKPNNVGNVGEKYLQVICGICDIKCEIDGSKTKKTGGGGIGDGRIKNKNIEVKTARQGKTKTFQHELGEHPWKSDFIALVDFTPSCIYLSIIKNFTQEHYQTPKRKAMPYFNKSITLRKETSSDNSGAFKLTLNENDLVTSDSTIKIDEDTSLKEIGSFIHKSIN
jgi:hypothetical protein